MTQPSVKGVLSIDGFATLLSVIKNQGYDIIGPTLQGDAITYDKIESIDDLPQGITDVQEKGYYRTKKTNSPLYFDYNLGARSWKQFLFLPQERLGVHKIESNKIKWIPHLKPIQKRAFLGIRSCELHAVSIQDKVFLSDSHPDPHYQNRKNATLMIAVNCSKAGNTCFCESMNTGPEVKRDFDLALTEILDKDQHFFLIEGATEKGIKILESVPLMPWQPKHKEYKLKQVETTIKMMGRKLDTDNIKQKLYDRHHHPHWEDVATRCVNCANCTLACPTCFCSSTEESPSLDQKESVKTRVWDSCFSQQVTYIHDAFVRESAASRYRQWMTHKLASWIDQFGTSGCVGCGRCITWCPVGIDLTEEYTTLTADKSYEDN